MRRYILMCILWLPFLSHQATAQITPVRFEHISVEEGLSQASVSSIIQDHRGFMWFGTHDGLNRYDGINFTTFRRDPENDASLSDNWVECIYEDSQHRLWVGTSNGLNLFDRNTTTFTRYLPEKDNPHSISGFAYRTIFEDSKGNIWIGTIDGGLNRFVPGSNAASDTFIHYLHDPNNPQSISNDSIRSIVQGADGAIWIGTFGGGLNRLDPQTETFERFRHNPKNEKSLADDAILSMVADPKGGIWIGTNEGGLDYFDIKTRIFKHHKPTRQSTAINDNVILSVLLDQNGNVWAGSNSEGLNHLDTKTGLFSHFQYQPQSINSLYDNYIFSLYEDPMGVLWIGTLTGGVHKYDPNRWKFVHYQQQLQYPNSLHNNTIWSIYKDREGEVWIGTTLGIDRLNKEKTSFQLYEHDPANSHTLTRGRVWSITQSHDGDIWIGTSAGLSRLNKSTNRISRYLHDPQRPNSLDRNLIRALFTDSEGNIWIGNNQGLDCLPINKSTQKLPGSLQGINIHFQQTENNQEKQGLTQNSVTVIYEDQAKDLWVGTRSGLNHLQWSEKQGKRDLSQPTITQYFHDPENPQSISDDVIRSIYQDPNGFIWVGTNEGLNRLDPISQTWIHYRENQGLPNNVVYGVLGTKNGDIWASTNNGITRFSPQNQTFRNFGVEDGLQSNEFNAGASFQAENGELYFGGINGFNIFHPDQIHDNPSSPEVVITQFQLINESVPIGELNSPLTKHISETEEIKLSHDDYVFSFGFAALGYTLPEKNQFAYMMEGFDKDWNFVGTKREATYTNLDPGNYVFKVKASNHDGIWNETGTSIKIFIEPPFWQRWWFITLCILIGLGLIYAFIRWRIQNLKSVNERLERKVDKRTRELNDQKIDLQRALEGLRSAQTQLVMSEKMASLGQLTAGIAHEINNPINFVSSNIHALRLDMEDLTGLIDKIHQLEHTQNRAPLIQEIIALTHEIDSHLLKQEILELIGGIERGAYRTKEIVNGLRTFTHLGEDDFVEVDIREGIDSTLVILQSKLKDRINVHKNYDKFSRVHCLPGKLNQVFLNVLDNAIQAIEGDGEIFISTERIENQLKICIRDTGKGMDDITQKKLFEPFFTTKQIGKGTGLGMSISYGIIEQHQGKIIVESEVGKGTSFFIILPIHQTKLSSSE